MKREFLSELGLDDEKIDKIMAEHGKTVNSTKEELDKVKSDYETIKSDRDSLQSQIQDRDKQLDDLSKQAKDHEGLKAQIDTLKQANEEQKRAMDQKLKEQTFNYELDRALMQAKARNPKAVKGLLNNELIQLGDDNQIIGLSEQLEKLKESDGYLFEPDEGEETNHANDFHKPGSDKKTNNPKKVNAKELGKQKALERFKTKESE